MGKTSPTLDAPRAVPCFDGLAAALKLVPWEWLAENEYTFDLEQEMWEPDCFTCRFEQSGDTGDTILSSGSRPAYAVRGAAAIANERAKADA